ncbi:type II secretion system F family protein [Vibrio fluvialis]|jgi:tight adherence protein B|uniref:type II secretion system F family protein n=1 Tax=Vibrio fluvialis TaxID=676 RepID=UPI000C21BFE8|nr:type II secretion system F family protein [Vibrio fluvialis]ELM6621183.1 type II secretion system F family protein [Vibrio fluvialis]MBY7824607.1 type II secretion system F family protein [Vibrio fluvialis]MBY7883832.1 type II secretion system F family protein [Vibrio fluvialis]MBY7927062.1 type II secretion system F family protein [Vibrio fluvialis]MBY8007501.1 type II secretion system F family protein [Vibrio fluvialis]
MQEYNVYFFVLLFIAVFLVSQAFLLPTAGKKVRTSAINKRLRDGQSGVDQQSRSLLNEHYLKSLSPFDRKLVEYSFFSNMKKNIELAGLDWTLSRVFTVVSLLQIITIIVLTVTNQPIYISVPASFLWWAIFHFYIVKKTSSRLMKFEEQFPDALDIMKRMLLAGNPINTAINEVGKELPDPIGSEFQNTFNLLNYGYDIRLAIMQMVERNPTVSVFAFSSAVLLQKETGGNLAENLDKVSKVLRARFKLSRKIKTLSAESKMSAWILILVPFVVFVALNVVNPNFIAPLYNDPLGLKLILGGIVGIVIGALWIRKIINFEV